MTDTKEGVDLEQHGKLVLSAQMCSWELGGATYKAAIKMGDQNKWSFHLQEKFPNKAPWEREGDGYQSALGAQRAAASAYKKRAKLSADIQTLVKTIFG